MGVVQSNTKQQRRSRTMTVLETDGEDDRLALREAKTTCGDHAGCDRVA